MKIKNKGKVYPSPSPSPSLSPSSSDFLSVLQLLPAAILTLASLLSLEDREVLAYMITRSLKTPTTTRTTPATPTPTPTTTTPLRKSKDSKNKPVLKPHESPVFDCDCFNCYTSYWYKWDSSENRELISQAIEAFEDHLTTGEAENSKKASRRGKKREKFSRRVGEKPEETPVLPENKDSGAVSNKTETSSTAEKVVAVEENTAEVTAEIMPPETAAMVSGHRGLARKMFPDVLGLFNSRLWSLWNPNV